MPLNHNNKTNSLYYAAILTLVVLTLNTGCKKFTEVSPPDNSVTQESVYADDATAASVMTGLYARMQFPNEKVLFPYISLLAGLSADEFGLWSGAEDMEQAYYKNDLFATADFSVGHEYWNKCYDYIYTCNSAIIGLTVSNTLSPSVKTQLLGEAKFIRAILYFYLVNLYGGVPKVISIDAKANSLLPRSTKDEIYELIEKDLTEAKDQLSETFLNGGLRPYAGIVERTRPTKWAATALLSRVYLYREKYQQAIDAASIIINKNSVFSLTGLNDVFIKTSTEAIWQMQGVETGFHTQDAKIFNLNADVPGFSPVKPAYLSKYLLGAFEPGDSRKQEWMNKYIEGTDTFYFPYKYKLADFDPNVLGSGDLSEYLTVFRLPEQYLIRAEAYARMNQGNLAVADINVIRTRARALPTAEIPDPLPDLEETIGMNDLMDAIIKERQTEYFSEWGHRWLDLKRTGRASSVMSSVCLEKGGTWQETDLLYPLPYLDITRDPNLTGHQNPGY